MIINNRDLKTVKVKLNGRSADFISPSFGTGCLLECSYCYMKRNTPVGLTIYNNVDEILQVIDKHSKKVKIDKPNQTDDKYITYDISCNEDFALHAPNHEWEKIFNFFKNHRRAKATIATKIIPKIFLKFNPNNKVRLRFSLMPQKIADVLEPKSAKIINRIKAINLFIEAGYDVHINFSPVVLYKGWLEDYTSLFNDLNLYVKDEYKNKVLSEVIFLTHNKSKHYYNIQQGITGEHLLWNPNLQEEKISQYGGSNLRYKLELKSKSIEEFKELHNNIISWNTIRYIF